MEVHNFCNISTVLSKLLKILMNWIVCKQTSESQWYYSDWIWDSRVFANLYKYVAAASGQRNRASAMWTEEQQQLVSLGTLFLVLLFLLLFWFAGLIRGHRHHHPKHPSQLMALTIFLAVLQLLIDYWMTADKIIINCPFILFAEKSRQAISYLQICRFLSGLWASNRNPPAHKHCVVTSSASSTQHWWWCLYNSKGVFQSRVPILIASMSVNVDSLILLFFVALGNLFRSSSACIFTTVHHGK